MADQPEGSLTRRAFVVRGAASLGALAVAPAVLNRSARLERPAKLAGAKRFKSINVGASAPPLGLDPAKTTSTELAAFQEMFEPLINRMTDRSLVPALAQGPLTRLDDTTWSATLRAGRTFTDGTPITVEDVKFSFDRILDPKFASAYLDYINFIKSVTIINKTTLHIKTTGPIDIVPDRAAVVRVVPMAVVKKKGNKAFSLDPGVGSGSMINSKPLTSSGIYLRAYDKYNGVFPVYTDTGSYLYIPEAETRIAQLKSGQIQITDSFPPSLYNSIKSSSSLRLGETPLAASSTICTAMFNCAKKPFSDVRVRQAFMYALDRDQLVQIGSLGHAIVADSPLPKANPFHVAPSIFFNHDPEKAKSLLKAAGYDSSVPFELNVSNISPTMEYAPLMQQQLKAGGFNPQLRVRGIDGAFSEIFAGKYQSFVFPTQFEVFSYDVDMLIRGWWGGYFNQKAAFWTTPGAKSIPTLLDKALVTQGTAAKKALYAKVQQIIVEEAASSPLIFQPSASAWNKELIGFKPSYTFVQSFAGLHPA